MGLSLRVSRFGSSPGLCCKGPMRLGFALALRAPLLIFFLFVFSFVILVAVA